MRSGENANRHYERTMRNDENEIVFQARMSKKDTRRIECGNPDCGSRHWLLARILNPWILDMTKPRGIVLEFKCRNCKHLNRLEI